MVVNLINFVLQSLLFPNMRQTNALLAIKPYPSKPSVDCRRSTGWYIQQWQKCWRCAASRNQVCTQKNADWSPSLQELRKWACSSTHSFKWDPAINCFHHNFVTEKNYYMKCYVNPVTFSLKHLVQQIWLSKLD